MGVGFRGRVEVLVRFPGQNEAAEAVRFEADRRLEDQLAGLCVLRDVPYNQDDNYQVLVGAGGSSGSSAGVVLGSVRALGALPARSACELRPGVEVAHAQLSRIEGASRGLSDPARRANLRAALGTLLRSTQDSAWFAEEVVAQDGIQTLLDALVLAAPQEEEDQEPASGATPPGALAAGNLSLAELAASCIGELLQYENGVAWCEQSPEQLMHTEVFTALVRTVLGASGTPGMAMPKASLGLSLFLLATLPATATSGFHMAASANNNALYRRLIQACLRHQAAWCTNAASALLAALLEAEQETAHLVTAVESSIRRAGESEDAGSFVAELLKQGTMERQASWIQQLLSDSLSASSEVACGALEVEASLAYAARMARRAEAGRKQDSRCGMLEARLVRLQDELRRTHLAMRSMVRLVNVGDHPFLRENLDVIVRTGFDSVLWEKGYTALHYAAEAVDDINVVEMLCHLASNLKAPDDEGLRPAEYARRAGRPEAAELIEGLVQQRGERQEQLAKGRGGSGSGRPGLPPARSSSSLASRPPDGPPTGSIMKKVTFSEDAPRRATSEVLQATRSEGSTTTLRWASGFIDGAGQDGEEYDKPLRVLARQLRGYLVKNATSGAWYARTQRRYFAMTSVPSPPPGVPLPHYELGYWETDAAFHGGDVAKGSINARHIIEVCHGTKGLAEASVGIKYRDGANVKELVVMTKNDRGLPCAEDAERWAATLREFCKALGEAAPAAPGPEPGPPPTGTVASLPSGAAASDPHVPADTAAAGASERHRLLAAATARTLQVGRSISTNNLAMCPPSPRLSPTGSPKEPVDSWSSFGTQGEAAATALPLDSTKRRRRTSSGKAPRGAQVRVRFHARNPSSRDSAGGDSPGRDRTSGSLDFTEDGYDSDPGPGQQPTYFRMNSMNSEAAEACFEHQPEVFRMASVRSTFNDEEEPGSDPETPNSTKRPSLVPMYSTERLYDDSWVLDGPQEEQPTLTSAYSSEKLYEDTSWLDVAYQSRGARRQRTEDGVGLDEEEQFQPPPGITFPISTPAASVVQAEQSLDFGPGLRGQEPRTPSTQRKELVLPVGSHKDADKASPHAAPVLADRPASQDQRSTSEGGTASGTQGQERAPSGAAGTQGQATASPGVLGSQGQPTAPSAVAGTQGQEAASPGVLGSQGQSTASSAVPGTQGQAASSPGVLGSQGQSTAPSGAAGTQGQEAASLGVLGSPGQSTAPSGAAGSQGQGIASLGGSFTPGDGTPGSGGQAGVAAASPTSAGPPSGGGAAPPGAGEPGAEATPRQPPLVPEVSFHGVQGETAEPPPKPQGKGSKGTPPPPLTSSQKGTLRASKGGKGGPPPPAKGAPGGKGKSKGRKATEDDLEDGHLRQPAVKPGRPMKALWWTRFEYGRHLKDGSTIWDKIKDFNVEIPKDVFEERFAKQKPRTSQLSVDKRKAEREGPKELRIIHDPNKIVGKEGALKNFPPAEAVAQALMELDPLVLDSQRLATVKDHFCPMPAEVTRLEECRQENPDVPFAPPERYMWQVSRVPAFRARVECWSFVNSYEERATTYASVLAEFQRMEDSLLNSKVLPQMLAHILWVGNYLNGGTKRGRADGFDLETLGKLDSVKDNESLNGSRDVRHFIFELFFLGIVRGVDDVPEQQMEAAFNTGVCLLEDFIPLFRIVNRTLMRDKEGMTKVVKTVKIVLEDVEKDVQELAQSFATQQESLLDCLKYIDDPADPMKLVMAENFAEARPRLARLEAQAKRCRQSFSELLAHFNHPGMKSSDFVLLWDDFFIPEDLILNKPETLQKSEILPHFCRPQVRPSVDNLMVLWEIRTPEEVIEAAAARRKRVPPRRRPRQQRAAPPLAPSVARFAVHWRKRASKSGEQLSG